jgi:CxxC motif-containing protein (DUF1111 family)
MTARRQSAASQVTFCGYPSMKLFKRFVFVCAGFAFALPVAYSASSEAPTGFDNLTNGFVLQAQFDQDREVFEEREGLADGLGPVFNAQSCAECHQTPVTGGVSQVSELRAGHFDSRRNSFRDHPGGSLINDRAINAAFQEHVQAGNEVRAQRSSLNVLGDGFVEALADDTLINISNRQPGSMKGTVIKVPLSEAPGSTRVGRFGWKNQQASLLSFAADAYLNEMGITSPFQPTDNTSNGTAVSDGVADPEDDGDDVEVFAQFMRSTKAPPRDLARANTSDARAGENFFDSIGCDVCHVPTLVTAPVGTSINGGTFIVPKALGDKVIHPFSDFLLHDVGTGDGIVQNGGNNTRNKLRTVPLWGLRTRSRFMHDNQSMTVNDAILRHGGQASQVISNYRNLGNFRQSQLLAFLASL